MWLQLVLWAVLLYCDIWLLLNVAYEILDAAGNVIGQETE
jgi:hypothetical protein